MRRCQVGSAVIMRSRDLLTEDDAGLLKRLQSFHDKTDPKLLSFRHKLFGTTVFAQHVVCSFCVLYHTVLQTKMILILLNYFSFMRLLQKDSVNRWCFVK